MKIDTTLNNIEATSQRTMKYVRYFGKTMMTDKFMLCMILMILIALLAIVIVAVMKYRQ
jgi:t-SNARE complex subunit (syntaxin)